jgi:hypothetical protein
MRIALSVLFSGNDELGMFWMLVGLLLGSATAVESPFILLLFKLTCGQYPVSGAGATEGTDEDSRVRKFRGFIFAMIGGH